MDVELVSYILKGIFDLEEIPSSSSVLDESRNDSQQNRSSSNPAPDGTTESRELLAGFFPGETTSMYSEQWRRRVQDELGLRCC